MHLQKLKPLQKTFMQPQIEAHPRNPIIQPTIPDPRPVEPQRNPAAVIDDSKDAQDDIEVAEPIPENHDFDDDNIPLDDDNDPPEEHINDSSPDTSDSDDLIEIPDNSAPPRNPQSDPDTSDDEVVRPAAVPPRRSTRNRVHTAKGAAYVASLHK